MDGYEKQNNQFWRHFLRFIDVYNFIVMIIVENVLILNKPKAEYNVITLTRYLGNDVNDLKCFKS